MITGMPIKLKYKWYTSNIRLMIGETLQLMCNVLHSTINYYPNTTKFSWKKVSSIIIWGIFIVAIIMKITKCIYFQNGKPLVLADNNEENNTNLAINKEILLTITSDEKASYECVAENYYHKMYSAYTLNVVGMIVKFKCSTLFFFLFIRF